MHAIDGQRFETCKGEPAGTSRPQGHVGVAHLDENGGFKSANSRCQDLLGYTEAELRTLSLAEIAHPDDREAVEAGFRRLNGGESYFVLEKRSLRKDGTVFCAGATVTAIRDGQGRLSGAVAMILDLTPVQEAGDRQRRLYETALSHTPDLVYVFDREHRFTYANQALLSMWGRTLDEAIGKRCLELGYEPWHADMHEREIDQVVATRKAIRGEVAFTGTNGRRLYDYIFAPVFGADGEVEAIAGTTRDVTEKHRAAAAIRFLADLTQELAPLSTEQEIVRQTVKAVGTFVGAHRCYFVECFEADNSVQVSENWVRDGALSLQGRLTLYDFGGAAWWRAYSKGNFAVADTQNHPLIDAAAAANYARNRLRSYAVQPVKRSGECSVVLAVTDDRVREWTSEELQLVENVGARVWPLVERARSEAALRVARDEALAASRAKDNFLATLSHELRTPLNPVLLLASEAAANESLPPEIRRDFELIAHNVGLEKRLIDDLLDLTSIAHNKLTIDLEAQDVHVALEQAIENIRRDLAQKQLQLDVKFTAPGSMVLGDGVRLQQVFWNLLRNAVKFTPAGGRISVVTHPSLDNEGCIRIDIADTGYGLTPRELATVFDPFAQGEHSGEGGPARFGGLGLGLAISRKLAELHAGTVTGRSEGRDRGATFTVELPLAATPGALPSQRGERARAPARRGFADFGRVLLVEDHEPSRLALARLLAIRELEVVQAGSAAEALACTQPIGLVISDIGLPDGNGLDLMRTLGERHACVGIALSGYGSDADLARSREAGFSLHLTKPIRTDALDRALEQLALKLRETLPGRARG